MNNENENYCYKCGKSADFEIEVKNGDEPIVLKHICELCWINLMTALTDLEVEIEYEN